MSEDVRRAPDGPSVAGRRLAFELLGPLQVWLNGQRVDVRAPKHRSLLALLALRAGEVVPKDQLIAALWPESVPRTAVGSLQNFVSDLRRQLGADFVVTRAGGYSLEADREAVDVHRFERLLADATATDSVDLRSQLLRQALALWRGPPLADFAVEPFAQIEIARLEELRMVAREELIDVELALGHEAAVVSELEALIADHPLRERLRAQLMIALYRSGRQAEALEAYRDTRRTLTEDLGLEPGDELQRLEKAILVHDSALLDGRLASTRDVAFTRRPDATVISERGPRRRELPGLRRWLVIVAALFLVALAAAIGATLLRDRGTGVDVLPHSVAVVDADTNRLTDVVPVGPRPVAIAYGEGGVWVANADDGTVSRVNPRTRTVVEVIRVGADARDLATGFGSVWVAGGTTGEVTRIDPNGNKVIARLPLQASKTSAPPVSWIATGAGSVWAADGTHTLTRIDPRSNAVVSRTEIPQPTGLAAGLGAAWVVTAGRELLKVVPRGDRAGVAMKLDLLSDARAPAVGAGAIWVIVDRGAGEIWRVDPDFSTTTIHKAGRYPLDLAVGERGQTVWATDSTGSLLRINPDIDLTVARIRTASTIYSALAVGGGAVWVAVQE